MEDSIARYRNPTARTLHAAWGRGVFLRALASELRDDAGIYVLVAAYFVVAAGVLVQSGLYDPAVLGAYVPMWQVMFLITFPAIFLSARLAVEYTRRSEGAEPSIARIFAPQRTARLVAGLALMQFLLLFQIAFTAVKNAMPLLREGFPHDRWQADFDRYLHFGVDPVSFLHTWFGSQTLTLLLEQNYSKLWFMVTFGCVFVLCVHERARAWRTHFVLLFVASWILVGNVLAFVFLSAGPIFYGEVTGDHERFASIARHVFDNGSGASFTQLVQAYLWQMHASGDVALGTGISAFPSVHVAATTVVCLAAWRASRLWGWAAIAYLAIIQFSSVYLGWHYAIDGYCAIAAVVLADRLLRFVLRPENQQKLAE